MQIFPDLSDFGPKFPDLYIITIDISFKEILILNLILILTRNFPNYKNYDVIIA